MTYNTLCHLIYIYIYISKAMSKIWYLSTFSKFGVESQQGVSNSGPIFLPWICTHYCYGEIYKIILIKINKIKFTVN